MQLCCVEAGFIVACVLTLPTALATLLCLNNLVPSRSSIVYVCWVLIASGSLTASIALGMLPNSVLALQTGHPLAKRGLALSAWCTLALLVQLLVFVTLTQQGILVFRYL